MGTGYHATSKDGLTFERIADVQIAGRRSWLGDAKSDGEKITFYGTGEGGVWTATSVDGNEWDLGRPVTGVGVADVGTTTLQDGSLLTGEDRGDSSIQPGQTTGFDVDGRAAHLFTAEGTAYHCEAF